MTPEQLDAAIRIAAVTVTFLLAWLLVRTGPGRGPAPWLFLPLALCLSGFVAGNTPDPASRPSGYIGAAAHLASGYTVIFLWWFCLACFDRNFRPRGGSLAIGAAWFCIASADRGLLGSALADKGLSYALVAIGFGIVAHLAWRLLTDRDGDLIERRHDARVLAVVLLGGQLLADLSVDLLFGFAWRPRAFTIAQNAAILGFGLWLAGRLLRVESGVLTFDASPTALLRPVRRGTENTPLARRLRKLIEDERVHLDPELTFAGFVARMGAPERAVRQLINHRLGHDHFRSFLNAHRMEEARRLLADPARASDKLIAIALDSGFASLASFNRVFRAAQGCTPSAYRAVALGQVAATRRISPRLTGFEERPSLF
jgi:AraC-like DNA-binding protein